MKLHGTMIENLRSAVASAERLRGRPVYSDTVRFWQALLDEAGRTDEAASGNDAPALAALMARLAQEIAARSAENGGK
ncbi:hypothetical protein [Sphingomonas sp. MMS24-J13]|uniref:hypothetical protein n=1 Tax=Sphingomonas sp. MMS24-J13 TaxID=3238686 RepID=UPI00384BAEB5